MPMRILAALVLAAVVGLGCATTKVAVETTRLLPEGHMPLGKATVWPLSDGELLVPAAYFHGVVVGEKLRVLGIESEEALLPTSLNAYFIELGAHRILVDAGCGATMGPSMGQLVSALAAKNIAPESITDVLVTHLHGDHFGGLLDDDMQQLRFPQATVWIHETELAFWTGDAEQVSEEHRAAFTETQQGVQLLATALGGKLKTFRGEQELFPGLKAILAPGHTPGHSVFMLESEDKKLLIWGDLMHSVRLQTAFPQAYPIYDAEPATATATRLHWIDRALKEGFWVAGMHLPHPGIGRFEKEADDLLHFRPIEVK